MKSLPEEVALDLALDEAEDEAHLRARVAKLVGVPEADLPAIALRKRSIDARRGGVRFHLLLEIGAEPERDLGAPHPKQVAPSRIVVVGDGPAGLFCAYELARSGIGCTVIDRGKPVQPRRHDLKGLNRRGEVDSDSNYCFGEGGAGTYSDGKLYTRAHKRGSVRDVIEILTRHGAPPAILTDARPHIGSNRLPHVVSSMRAELERAGVQFRFGARVTGIVTRGAPRRIEALELHDGGSLECETCVLATGHSAADVYAMLLAAGVSLEPKGFALGVRIEHPQALINRIQYGAAANHPALPAAAYRLAQTVDERGVFSFCMCPGGFIVPASTVPEGLVVNGMSLTRRASRYANSGLVVSVEPDDVARAGYPGVLGGVELQRALEHTAFVAGGGMLRAPATRATDFVAGRASTTLPSSSYLPGLTPSNVADVLDSVDKTAPALRGGASVGLGFAARIRGALHAFNRNMRGYLGQDAVLVGVESRTSSPLRIPRDAQTLQSPDVGGLYPAGEGAGFAGGIMSAAMDGVRIARQIAARSSE